MADSKTNLVDNATDRELVLSRTVNAPRELVWEAWTNPEHLIHWWGPNGFTNTFHEIDIRPGGVWRFMMHGPDGTDYPNKIVFCEVVKPERLVYAHDDDGEGCAKAFSVTVTLEDQGDKTVITMRTLFATAEERNNTVAFGAVEGGNQTLGRLEALLAKTPFPEGYWVKKCN